MGNRVGVIFHENYENFSPLIYDHFSGKNIESYIFGYIEDYKNKYPQKNHNGHLYNCEHMTVGFLIFIKADKDVRVENLSDAQLWKLENDHIYPNCFEGGCFLVNVDENNFGNIEVV